MRDIHNKNQVGLVSHIFFFFRKHSDHPRVDTHILVVGFHEKHWKKKLGERVHVSTNNLKLHNGFAKKTLAVQCEILGR